MTGIRRLRSGVALELRGLTCGWGRRELVSGLSLRVQRGERLAVLGPNGAGKTTLFDAVAGRLRERSGQTLLGGHDVSGWPLHRRVRHGLGYVPQEPSVFGALTVEENLSAAADSPAARRVGAEGVEETLESWGLSEVSDRLASVLSGGERRRVEVARALMVRPSVLMLDEPFAGLDPAGRAALQAGLEHLSSDVTLLVTDHSADDLLALCGRVVLLVEGRIQFDGPRDDFVPGSPPYRRYFATS